MANQHGFELLPARRQVDVGGIDHGRLAAPVPPARVTGLPLLGRFGIGFVEIGRMVHLDLYDEPIEPRPGRELQVETAARRGTRYAVRQRFAFRRQVKPVGILHAPAMAPVRQRLPAAVSARRQPGLGGLRIFDPDRDLRRVLPFNPQEQGKIMQPCVAPFHDNFHASLFIFDQLLIAGTKQYER